LQSFADQKLSFQENELSVISYVGAVNAIDPGERKIGLSMKSHIGQCAI
jgi:hypothetical protein